MDEKTKNKIGLVFENVIPLMLMAAIYYFLIDRVKIMLPNQLILIEQINVLVIIIFVVFIWLECVKVFTREYLEE